MNSVDERKKIQVAKGKEKAEQRSKRAASKASSQSIKITKLEGHNENLTSDEQHEKETEQLMMIKEETLRKRDEYRRQEEKVEVIEKINLEEDEAIEKEKKSRRQSKGKQRKSPLNLSIEEQNLRDSQGLFSELIEKDHGKKSSHSLRAPSCKR
ncbi:hypothetical protein DFH28DRAFT_924743 [Melampsora americana]|nr:hypothetical protein DFH28DRAFT_924743 [Melampsora americana]